ncbi:MAG: spore maturation protein [Clostridia bacterium]|nr:spore maturation protein [Clostridia bacterium]
MISALSNGMLPLFFLSLFVISFLKKRDSLSAFTKGAKEGFSAIVKITPNILAIMVSIAVFRESGALTFFLKLISPLFQFLKIPEGIGELILVRPISGSGAMVLLTDILEKFGADSYEGLLASVICASTETTIYTITVYFAVTRVKKTKLPLLLGLCADMIVIFLAMLTVNLFLCSA